MTSNKSTIASKRTLHLATEYLKTVDPIIGSVIKGVGQPTISPHSNYYQELVESIVSQQLSVKAADTILKRFLGLFPGDQFPAPELILGKAAEELRAVGLSWQKAGYIQDLALKIIEGTVKFDHLDMLSNDEIIAELTKVKGVGVWTVHMFLIFCMGRMDVLPVGDLGIKNGIQKLYDLDATPTPEVIQNIAVAGNWHPYESIASWYVWRSLGNKPGL
ncbi:MAG TPA: DNA-3-methyladenine glycosylase 2 family protein [Candidatus Saccharibacteria bacterium]|nr:DNA-3-methyladenine glycosylase 2 family protein [Candidatus Saccharibacteria bacterium]